MRDSFFLFSLNPCLAELKVFYTYEYCFLDHIPALEFLPAVLLPTTRREPQDDKWQERELP